VNPDPESVLARIRLRASATGVRDRVLARAHRESRERRLFRRTWALAAAVFAISAAINSTVEFPAPPELPRPQVESARLLAQAVGAAAAEPRFRVALGPARH